MTERTHRVEVPKPSQLTDKARRILQFRDMALDTPGVSLEQQSVIYELASYSMLLITCHAEPEILDPLILRFLQTVKPIILHETNP